MCIRDSVGSTCQSTSTTTITATTISIKISKRATRHLIKNIMMDTLKTGYCWENWQQCWWTSSTWRGWYCTLYCWQSFHVSFVMLSLGLKVERESITCMIATVMSNMNGLYWCSIRATSRCASSELSSRWFHMSFNEHYYNYCYNYFYKDIKKGHKTFDKKYNDGYAKNWVVECCHGYLFGARCRFVYGPADATAIRRLLLPEKGR